jgi:hypothetical protein
MKIIRYLFLISIVPIISCSTFSNSYKMKNLVSQGKSDTDLFIGMSYNEVIKILGIPDRKLNYQGSGYFHYKNIGIYFSDIVGYYENDKFIETDYEKYISMIAWHSSALVFGIKLNVTTKGDVHSILGNPTLSKFIELNSDSEDFITGDIDLYRSDKYCFLIRYNESQVSTECMLLPSRYFFMDD